MVHLNFKRISISLLLCCSYVTVIFCLPLGDFRSFLQSRVSYAELKQMVWCCVAWGVKHLFVHLRLLRRGGWWEGNKQNAREPMRRELRGTRVYFWSGFATCWVSSLTTFAWSVFERRYIHAYRFFCIMAERTKLSIHVRCTQRSFRLLSGTIVGGHPTSSFGKHLFGRRFEI